MKLEPKSKSRPGVHYYVQPTIRDGKRLVNAIGQAADEEHAKRIAYRMFERAVGVIAFEIDVDMDGS